MAKKGSAKKRFENAARAVGDRNLPAYIHDAHAGSLRISYMPKAETTVALVDCTVLLSLPRSALGFASALSRWAGGKMRSTVESKISNLNYGFIRFAKERQISNDLRVQDIDTALINSFINFLSEKRLDGSYVLSAYTRIHHLGALKTIIRVLKELDEPLASDCEIQPNPWPLSTRSRQAPKGVALSKDEASRFYRFCRANVAATMEEVRAIWKEEEGDAIDSGPRDHHKSLYYRAKARFGCAFPERKELKATNDPLFDEIETRGYKQVARSFGPYTADLCPFVYYLLFTTGFNLQPLVDTQAGDVRQIENMGRKLISIGSLKHRALSSRHPHGKPVRASFTLGNDQMSPAAVLQFLLRWTSYLRQNSKSSRKEALFLFIPRNRAKASRLDSYAHEGRRTTDFQRHTTAFCRTSGFGWIGARKIRGFFADLADEMLEGDVVAVGHLLQHSHLETTRRHYQSAAVLTRRENYLALGMQLRQRWVDSDGKIEPRNVAAKHDHSAATSGFRCVDPYDSPVPGQESGKLCTAYGACPSCPLAMLDITSTYAAARCFQWKTAMAEARAYLGVEAFHVRWGKSYWALVNVWLPAFPAEMWNRAAKLELPPLEELE